MCLTVCGQDYKNHLQNLIHYLLEKIHYGIQEKKAHTIETLKQYMDGFSYSQPTEQLHNVQKLSMFSEWKAYLEE